MHQKPFIWETQPAQNASTEDTSIIMQRNNSARVQKLLNNKQLNEIECTCM